MTTVRQHMESIGVEVSCSDEEIKAAFETIELWLRRVDGTAASKLQSMAAICRAILSSHVYWYIFQLPPLKAAFQKQISNHMSYCFDCLPDDPLYSQALPLRELGPKVLVYIQSIPDFVAPPTLSTQKRRLSGLDVSVAIRPEL